MRNKSYVNVLLLPIAFDKPGVKKLPLTTCSDPKTPPSFQLIQITTTTGSNNIVWTVSKILYNH